MSVPANTALPGLDRAGRDAIVAEWTRLAAEPPPPNPRPLGCATFLVAAALLLGLPALERMTGYVLPRPFGTIAFVALCILLAGGFVVSEGPTASGTFDVEAARSRLGATLEYVLAIERVLVSEQLLLPVFSGK